MIGLLGGPVGVGLGLIGGMIMGRAGDTAKEDDINVYLNKFAQDFSPGEIMLVAHLWEDSTFATDNILKPYNGTLKRPNVDEQTVIQEQAEMDEMHRDIAASEAAWATADTADEAEWDAKVKKETKTGKTQSSAAKKT